jgi:hypothetical protein
MGNRGKSQALSWWLYERRSQELVVRSQEKINSKLKTQNFLSLPHVLSLTPSPYRLARFASCR